MYVGTQLSGGMVEEFGDAHLRQLAQLGLYHVCIDPVGNPRDWTRDNIARHIERVDAAGLKLDMVQLPLASLIIDREDIDKVSSPAIVLGQGDERDRQIEAICKLIENLASLGVHSAKYNFSYLGVPRTKSERGRGGALVPTFRADQITNADQITRAGHVSADAFWERITYFLERVIPVAEANKVRLACHPNDPMTPPNYRGIEESVISHVDGLKRFVSIAESPYHGLNFCQGTIGESLENPREEIGDVIRWFGSRGKIFNVHFRNIKGKRFSFTEVFPDDGDMDMPAALKLYKEVGVDCMIMPDHVPEIDGISPFETGFAFCYGYIIGLFQANGWDPYGRA